MTAETSADLLAATAQLASAYFSRNAVPTDQIPQIMADIHGTLADLGRTELTPELQKPAGSIRKSATPEYLVCLAGGKHLKMLKRHPRTTYDLTPEQYRAKWGMSADYPMVAPNYAKARSEFAKKIGLGRPSQSGSRKRRSIPKAQLAA